MKLKSLGKGNKMVKKVKVEVKEVDEVENIVRREGSMSAKIRELLSMGHKRAEIAKILGIRYQWVRNVEITPLKKG